MGVLAYLSLGAVVASAAYLVLTGVAAWRFASDRSDRSDGSDLSDLSDGSDWPAVTILKPVCGADAEAVENFRSFLQQDYPRYQVIFGALDPDDTGLEVARQLAEETARAGGNPSTSGVIVAANPRRHGANLKVSNLINMLEHARHDFLVIADSDMRVTPDYLRAVIEPFSDLRVGLVTCPYRGRYPRDATSQERMTMALHSLGVSAGFMPSVFVARMLMGMRYAFGSTIAIRGDILHALGGFPAIKNHLADDYELGARVHALGYRVVLSRYVVDNVLSPEPFRDMIRRRLRWARTVKVCQRAGYLGSVVTHAVPLALLNACVWRGGGHSLIILMGVCLLRWCVVQLVTRPVLRDQAVERSLGLLFLNDVLSFLLWLWSWVPGPIVWRGTKFRLTREGMLEEM